jgi:uncharacterized membrane protein
MRNNKGLFTRVVVGLIFIGIILIGFKHIFAGNLNYSNYWGGIVFTPIAILIGILGLVIVVFRWESFANSQNQIKKKNNHK